MADNDDRSHRDEYWAAQDADGLAQEVVDRVTSFYNQIGSNGMASLWRKSYLAYYGMSQDGDTHDASSVQFGGDLDERVYASANHLRSIAKYLKTTATSDRPVPEPRATNTDSKSLAQTHVARSVLDYYDREQRMDKRTSQTTERAIVYGVGFTWLHWDVNAGPEVEGDVLDEETGEPRVSVNEETGEETVETEMRRAGEIWVKSLSPWDVIYDLSREMDECDWFIVRQKVNRWDIIAQAGDDEDLIESLKGMDPGDQQAFAKSFQTHSMRGDQQTDDVYVFHFYHAATPALPEGRYLKTVTADAWTFDGPLPYDEIPLYDMVPEDFLETAFGYAGIWDLIGLQQVHDSVLSTVITNVESFGVQNILAPAGTELDVEELAEGLNLITYPQGTDKPEVLKLLDVPSILMELKQALVQDMETLSGANSVARGQPEASLKSGAALALVQAQAIQFNGGLQRARAHHLEDVYTGVIRILKRYASTPRMMMIAGEGDRARLKMFQADDIAQVDRVVVDIGNPLSKTTAGKTQIAEMAMQMNAVRTPEQLLQVISTGKLETIFDPATKQIETSISENEALQDSPGVKTQQVMDKDGNPVKLQVVDGVPALIAERHDIHINKHVELLASPEARQNPQLVQAVLTHLMDHVFQWNNAHPTILASIGCPPPPQDPSAQPPQAPAPPNAVPPSGPMGPPGPGPGGVGPQLPPQGSPANLLDPAGMGAQQPNQPNMPQSPIEQPT